MARQVDVSAPARANMVPEVAEKLEAARSRLAGLEAQVGELVLDKTLEVPGAAGRLADFNGKIAEARNDVAQLEAGHQVAQRRAAQAEAARDAKGRRAQLSAMNKIAEARLEAKKILAGYWTAVPKS